MKQKHHKISIDSYSLFFVLFLVSLFFFLYNILRKQQQTTSPTTEKNKQTQALIRQTARWAVASQQDTSPMIALLHANYAAGYLQALELVATENEINQFFNLQKLRLKVYSTQDKAARKVISACPNYMGANVDKELASIGIETK